MKTTGKQKNPEYEKAFKALRRIMSRDLQELNFGPLKKFVLETVRAEELFILTDHTLDKIVAGNEDHRTKNVLSICAEYVRKALEKRGDKSADFDRWVKEFAMTDQAVPIIETISGKQDEPTTPQLVGPETSTPTVLGLVQGKQTGGLSISWLSRIELRYSSATSESPTGWPVSLAATLGLDRTSQVTICADCTAQTILKELMRVEMVLKTFDKPDEFPSRTWSIESGWLSESGTNSCIIELSGSDLTNINRDIVQGVVQRHFDQHSPSPSLVLVIPAGAAEPTRRIFEMLTEMTGANLGASVQLLKPAVANFRNVRSSDTNFLGLIHDFDSMKISQEDALAQATTSRLRKLLGWLSGMIDDEHYFGQLTTRDLKLIILSGRLGQGDAKPSPNAIHRSNALVKAATNNSDLLYGLGSLSVEPEIVQTLIHAPIHVRAVAGLLKKDEMSAVPAPWFQRPIDNWRHGRVLNTWVGSANNSRITRT